MPATTEQDVVAQLARFAGVSVTEMAEAERLFRAVEHPAGCRIFEQGDRADSTFLLVSGSVDILMRMSGAMERLLCTLQPGAIFGEMSMLLDRPRAAAAVARGDVRLYRVAHADLEDALAQRRPWAVGFLRATAEGLAARLLDLDRHLESVVTHVQQLAAAPDSATARRSATASVSELQDLRQRLATHWTF